MIIRIDSWYFQNVDIFSLWYTFVPLLQTSEWLFVKWEKTISVRDT